MLLMVFVTCSVPTPPEELTEIQWGGGGGIPGLDAPIGETPQGDPDGGNRDAQVNPSQSSRSTPDRSTPNTSTRQPTTTRTDNTLPAEQNEDRPTRQEDSPSESQNSESPSNPGTNNSDETQGSRDGEGTTPTGGSGGGSVGVGNGNIGRCWQVSPKATAAGQTTTISGTVNVTVTVKPDGRVIPGGTSGTASLASRARSLAQRARACPALDAGDVTVTLTYVFNAD